MLPVSIAQRVEENPLNSALLILSRLWVLPKKPEVPGLPLWLAYLGVTGAGKEVSPGDVLLGCSKSAWVHTGLQ